MYVAAFVFARGGSKGIPRKNLRLLAGKPLIAYSIEHGLASKSITTVILSTDDEEIAAVGRDLGAEVPFIRPKELAEDHSPEWLAWQHAIRATSGINRPTMDVFVSIPPTSPLRFVEDIDTCVETLLATDADIVITGRNAERNPYFNMVLLEDGYARLVIKPKQPIYRRQEAPTLFDVTTVAYAARPEYILNATSIFDGKVKIVVVPAERAIDIDTELDFQLAELIVAKRASR